MDYEKLKEVIAKQIKENGKREITGPVLQAVLMAMVDSLGEVYPQTYTEEEKAQARANIDALSNYDGEITKEKLSLEVQAILNDVANKQNITDASLATIAKTIVGAINEVYKGGLKDASIATSKIEDGAITDAKIASGAVTTPKIANDAVTTEKVNDGAITEPKLDTDLVNIITSAVQPAELASAIANALASYVAKADIVATTGSATDKVMSQHGVTEAINGVTNQVTELDREVGKLNDIIIEPDKTLLQGFYSLSNGKYTDDEDRNTYVCLKDAIGPFRLELNDGYYIDSVAVMSSNLQLEFSLSISRRGDSPQNKIAELLNTEYKYHINIRKVGEGEISKDEDIIKKLEIINNPSRKEQQVSILREGYEVSSTGVIVASGVSLISPIGVAKASKVYIDYPLNINFSNDCWCAFFSKDNTILSVVKPFSNTYGDTPNSVIFAVDVPADAYYIVCTKDNNAPIRVWLDEEDKSFRFIDLTRGYYNRIDGIRYTDDGYAPTYVSTPQLVTPSFYLKVKDDYIIDSVTKYNNSAFNSSGNVSLESIRISINDGFTYGINIVRKDGGQIATSVLPWDIIESLGDVEGQEIDAVTFIPSDNDGTIALGLNYKMKDYTENGIRYLSMTDDNGVTWNTIENIYGDIVFVHFFVNGNVLFATSKKCYYSSDNLTTIQESAVYDLDGSAFVADDADYFYQQRNYANENCVVDGTERLLWGDYYIGSVSSWQARIWETHDNGRTINCIFKYGTSQIDGQVIFARHSHAVFFNKYNQKWYGLSGDDGNRCNVIEISYNGSYNFSLIGMGDNYKFANAFFDADNAYFITDYTITGTIRGILRCPITQLKDFNNYKYIWKVDGNVPLTGYVADAVGHKFITPDGIGYNKLFFAESGLMFKRLFANFPDTTLCAPDWIFGPDYNGEYYVFCWKGGYSTEEYKMVLSGNLYNLSKAMEREGVILKGNRI